MVNISLKLAMAAAVAAAGFTLTPGQATARTVYCVNCADKFGQATQVAKNIETALNTARQLQTQIQQYNDMI